MHPRKMWLQIWWRSCTCICGIGGATALTHNFMLHTYPSTAVEVCNVIAPVAIDTLVSTLFKFACNATRFFKLTDRPWLRLSVQMDGQERSEPCRSSLVTDFFF